jgi:putative FmdB family regulatory protein
MPIFEFRCKYCNHVYEEFLFSSNTPIENIKCPTCGAADPEKLMSAFSSAGSSASSGYSAPVSSCGSGGFS